MVMIIKQFMFINKKYIYKYKMLCEKKIAKLKKSGAIRILLLVFFL